MRLPFPERIPLRYALYFSVLLCLAQLIQGTDPTFSLCCFLFIVIATLAFNLAGGLSRPSGGYVFFYAVLAVIVGLFWKVFLGEPADSNLKQPLLTIGTYLGGMMMMFVAVFLSRKLTAKRAFLADMIADGSMSTAAIGCLIVGLLLTGAGMLNPNQNGSILSAVNQVNYFIPLALMLGTISQIRRSGGTSSVNLIVLIAGLAIFIPGMLSFSKTGIFAPLLGWLIAAASQRYKVSLQQIVGLILMLAFMGIYLAPYSQYGRTFKTESLSANIDVSISLLSELQHIREMSQQTGNEMMEDRVQAYFDTPQGLFDRLQMLSPDDALINVTEQNGPIGFAPIVFYFENIIPHFIWPGKPQIGFGNVYAHEIGMIGDEDMTTGISFSPTGEAFHVGGWLGIFVLAPILWILLFTVFDSLCGDARRHPWGLLAIFLFSHVAPEGMLGSLIHTLAYGALGLVFAAFTTAYVMPVVGSIFSGPERTRLRRIAPVRSIPRRSPSIQSSRNSGQ